jgi:probable O-glycosylation ligase (exosortase A-associated)
MMIDILLTVAVIASLPLCFARPWIGILVFAWLGYMNPHRLTSGFAYSMPFAKMVAVATLGGLLFTKERRPLPRTRETYLLVAFWATMVCSTLFVAIHPERAWYELAQVSKMLLMTAATLMLFQEREKLRALLLVIAVSIGVYGVNGGAVGLLTRWQDRLWGPPESMLYENNALGFALTMMLPFFVFLRREESRAWVRRALLAAFGLSISAVFATYSRGAFTTLVLVLAAVVWKTRRADPAVVAVALCVPLLVAVTPRMWSERMLTIAQPLQQASGIQRSKSWYVAWHLGVDHPLLGAGFQPFSPDVYEHYLPGYRDFHNAHNHYLQVLAEHGFTGLLLFSAILASVFLTLQRTRSAVRGDPTQRWIGSYAEMLQVSLFAYAVGGAFLNMPYFDLYYQLVAIAVLLQQSVKPQVEGRDTSYRRGNG